MRAPDAYRITTDPAAVDLDTVHGFLTTSYWSPGIDRERVARAVSNSLCASALDADGRLVGFARAVTDYASFAYLADVFVLPEHRGQGLARRLVAALVGHPEMATIRKWMLSTDDAHGVYAPLGFRPLARPEDVMEHRPAAGQFSPPPTPDDRP